MPNIGFLTGLTRENGAELSSIADPDARRERARELQQENIARFIENIRLKREGNITAVNTVELSEDLLDATNDSLDIDTSVEPQTANPAETWADHSTDELVEMLDGINAELSRRRHES